MTSPLSFSSMSPNDPAFSPSLSASSSSSASSPISPQKRKAGSAWEVKQAAEAKRKDEENAAKRQLVNTGAKNQNIKEKAKVIGSVFGDKNDEVTSDKDKSKPGAISSEMSAKRKALENMLGPKASQEIPATSPLGDVPGLEEIPDGSPVQKTASKCTCCSMLVFAVAVVAIGVGLYSRIKIA